MKQFFVGFGIVVGILFLIMIILAGVMFFIVSSNNKDKGDKTTVLPGPDSSAPHALVMYQPTISGTGKTVADRIAAGLQSAGYEVTVTYPGAHVPSDISKYAVAAFGSSVYAGQPSAILAQTMKRFTDYSGIKVALYSIGSADIAPELDILEAGINGADVITKTKLKAGDKGIADEAYKLGTALAAD